MINLRRLMLSKDGKNSGILTRLKNILGKSTDGWVLNCTELMPRGIANDGSKNVNPLMQDSDGQKLNKSNNSEEKKKSPEMKVDGTVKLSDKLVESVENVEENFPKYVLKQKWGVNLLEPIKLEELPTTNKDVISRFDDVMQLTKKTNIPLEKIEKEKEDTSPVNTIVSPNESSMAFQQDDTSKIVRDQERKYELNENLKSNKNRKSSDNLNMIGEWSREDEVIAWQNIIVKTKKNIKKMAEANEMKNHATNIEETEVKFSILPEPPRPKLDMVAVKAPEFYNLIDAYMDPSKPLTAKGIRLALRQATGNKYSNNVSNNNQSPRKIPRQTSPTN